MNISDSKLAFLHLVLSVTSGCIKYKIYDNITSALASLTIHMLIWLYRVLLRTLVYISHRIRYASHSSAVDDFNNRNITLKVLGQGYRFYKPRIAFSKVYHRNGERRTIIAISKRWCMLGSSTHWMILFTNFVTSKVVSIVLINSTSSPENTSTEDDGFRYRQVYGLWDYVGLGFQ